MVKGFIHLFVIFLALALIAGTFAIYLSLKKPYPSFSKGLPAAKKSDKCPFTGELPKEFYLKKYTVVKGDNLLTIAQNELKDSSRVDELIQLNKFSHPQLSLENPKIEPGWQFLLPPKNLAKSTGILEGIGGEILEQNDSSITINVVKGKVVPTQSSKTQTTKYLNKSSFNVGDCVYIVGDASGREGTGILAVSPQDKNYFLDDSANSTNGGFNGNISSCPYSGFLDKDFYLTKYTVQKGDSISAVAQKTLNDASRADELININKPYYPHLSQENPFVEIGWEIRIPPKFLPKSNGFLTGIGGKVAEIDYSIFINLNYQQQGIENGYPSHINEKTKYIGMDSVNVDDCVYAIEQGPDTNGKGPVYLMVVTPQDKNYFK